MLPLSIVVAVILLVNGTPATFKGPQTIKTVQGDTVTVALGPAAPVVALNSLEQTAVDFLALTQPIRLKIQII